MLLFLLVEVFGLVDEGLMLVMMILFVVVLVRVELKKWLMIVLFFRVMVLLFVRCSVVFLFCC